MQKLKTKLYKLLPLLLLAIPAVANAATCDGVEVAVGVDCTDKDNVIFSYLGGIIKFIAPGVGIVIVLMIIIGGIRYIASGGNPEAAAAAKKMVTNALLALVAFIFLAAILNFIIPGGLL